jgi:6,7-dimethyl-8-ribityllumazine synthase
MGRTFEGAPAGDGRRFAIVIGRFNGFVTEKLRAGAVECLLKHGTRSESVDEIWVPGAFEIPLAARAAARSGRYDAVICLGAVIRGATPHFEYVARESAHGIGSVSLETGVPAIFGVLTTDTAEQAVDRAGGAAGNKGWDCALAALAMADLLDAMRRP